MKLAPRWQALLWIVTAVVAVPLLMPGWMPFCDLPEHAAAMGSIAHWSDPTYSIQEHYVMGWTTSQYLLLHIVGGLLTMLTGSIDVTIKLVLVLLVVAWVQSTRYLLRAFGGDQRLAIMSALLFWNRSLLLGFLPYLASLPVLFATLALFADAPERRPSGRRWRGLALAGIVVFYTHASAFTLLGGIAGVLALVDAFGLARGEPLGRRIAATLREAVIRLLWLAPAAVFAAVWVLRGRFGMHGSSIHAGDEIGTMNPLRALKVMALWAHDIWASHIDDALGIAFWGLFLFLVVASRIGAQKEESGHRSIVPFAVGLAVYLATPFRVGTGLLLNVRMAPVLALFALLAVRPRRGLLGSAPIVAAAALAVVQCVDNVGNVRMYQRDVDGLPALLDTMPRGAKLISLSFAGFNANPNHYPAWIYAGSYHRANHGGIASFSFSELPHWSVQYRQGGGPPKQEGLSWAMQPCFYRNVRDGAYFDYVLVRGAVDPFRDDPTGPRWKVKGKTAKFTLFEKDADRADRTDGADDGPCVGLRRPGTSEVPEVTP